MRSFSSFKPVLNVSPKEARAAKFAMWLRANARNVRLPFDRATWRTARPWLSFNEIRYELSRFRQRSLGALQLGNIRLENEDVECAVKYEALATRRIFQLDISEMIGNFFDIDTTARTSKRVVLDKINEEFLYLNRGTVSERDKSWKIAIKPLTKNRSLMLKPKIRERNLAALILQLFDVGDTPLGLDQIQAHLTPCLAAVRKTISAPLLRRALAITGVNLRFKNHLEIINGIIKKYYVPHELGEEDPDRVKAIVNQFVEIQPDNAVWDLVEMKKLVPRHDYTCEDYEQAFNEKYNVPPVVAPLQKPFFRYKHPYLYVRKKQDINWLDFLDGCTRKGGTDAATLDKANAMLVKKGFVPYEHCHPEFDRIKLLGVQKA